MNDRYFLKRSLYVNLTYLEIMYFEHITYYLAIKVSPLYVELSNSYSFLCK